MGPPASIVDLIERINNAYSEFTSTIATISDEWLIAPNAIGTWSVRDVIAHVGGDERWMAGQLEALRSGELPTANSCYGDDTPAPEGMDWSQDGRNAWQRERLRGLSLDEVRAMAAKAHARLLAVIESFSDDQLEEKLSIAELGTTAHIRRPNAGEQAWPLWEWIGGVTYKHYADHTADAAVRS